MADADRCVICGAIIPEGRMICPSCERGVKPAFRGAKLPPSLKGMQVDKELAKAEICVNCKHRDKWTGFCCEGWSPRASEITRDCDTCDFWTQKYPSATREGIYNRLL